MISNNRLHYIPIFLQFEKANIDQTSSEVRYLPSLAETELSDRQSDVRFLPRQSNTHLVGTSIAVVVDQLTIIGLAPRCFR